MSPFSLYTALLASAITCVHASQISSLDDSSPASEPIVLVGGDTDRFSASNIDVTSGYVTLVFQPRACTLWRTTLDDPCGSSDVIMYSPGKTTSKLTVKATTEPQWFVCIDRFERCSLQSLFAIGAGSQWAQFTSNAQKRIQQVSSPASSRTQITVTRTIIGYTSWISSSALDVPGRTAIPSPRSQSIVSVPRTTESATSIFSPVVVPYSPTATSSVSRVSLPPVAVPTTAAIPSATSQISPSTRDDGTQKSTAAAASVPNLAALAAAFGIPYLQDAV